MNDAWTLEAAERRHKHPDKMSARRKVKWAIEAGRLVRPSSCERCGVECKPDASHNDYSRPLDIEWLCKVCHYEKDQPDTGKCRNGHELEGENLTTDRDGYRVCRTCIRLACARYKAKKAAEDPMRGLRPRLDSTTGVRGVSPNGSGFRARIKRNGKDVNLGTFPTVEEAADAVSAARAEFNATLSQEVA